jgi:putative DNA primase/helicase
MDKKETDYTPKTIDPRSTELSQARRVVDANPHLRFAPGIGWLSFNGSKWVPDAEAAANEAVRTAADSATITFPGYGAKFASRRALVDVRAITAELSQTKPAELDTHKDWIHTSGITWDLRTGVCWPTEEDELNTKALDWEPATGCPEWVATLERCFPGEPEMVAYLQRLVGYGITGQTREHVFILLHGNGRNGKSTFINVLTHVFREYVQHIPVAVLMSADSTNPEGPSPMLLKMRGARMVFTSETARGGRLNEPMVKLLTGGDEITARGMKASPVTFKPEALIWMATNHKPEIQGTDEGIWNRVKLIEWRESFAGREDFGLEDRLKAEAPGIIDWALDGAREWYAGKLQEPERMRRDTKHFRAESDFFGSFVPDWLALDGSAWIPRKEVLAVYSLYCEDNGLLPVRNPSTLYNALKERGAETAIRNGVHGFRVRRAG